MSTLDITPDEGLDFPKDVVLTYTLNVDVDPSDITFYVQHEDASAATEVSVNQKEVSGSNWQYKATLTVDKDGIWDVDAEMNSATAGKDSIERYFIVRRSRVTKP